MSDSKLRVEWIDGGREPQCAPDPRHLTGVDVDMAACAAVTCSTPLPYPAQRCGHFIIDCTICGPCVGVTTAGRPDDPRSLRVACKPLHRA